LGVKYRIVIKEDVNFLSETFKGSGSVFVMATLGKEIFFDETIDIIKEITQLGKAFKTAIEQSGAKKWLH
jgi:hypothetical protein